MRRRIFCLITAITILIISVPELGWAETTVSEAFKSWQANTVFDVVYQQPDAINDVSLPYVNTIGFPVSWENTNREIAIVAAGGQEDIKSMQVNGQKVEPTAVPELSGLFYRIKQAENPSDSENMVTFEVSVKGGNFLGGMISFRYDTTMLTPYSLAGEINDETSLDSVFFPLSECMLITNRPTDLRNGGANIDLEKGMLFCTWVAPAKQNVLSATETEIPVLKISFLIRDGYTIDDFDQSTLSILSASDAMALKPANSGTAILITQDENQPYTLDNGEIMVGFDYQNSLKPGDTQFVYRANTADEKQFDVKIIDQNGATYEHTFTALIDTQPPGQPSATISADTESITVAGLNSDDGGEAPIEEYTVELSKNQLVEQTKKIPAENAQAGITFHGLTARTDYEVTIRSKDEANNISSAWEQEIRTKAVAPIVSIDFIGGTSQNGWYRTSPTIQISATENGKIEWKKSTESNWKNYQGPMTVNGSFDGEIQARATVEDSIGTSSKSLRIDMDKPVISDIVIKNQDVAEAKKEIEFAVTDVLSGMDQGTVSIKHANSQLGETITPKNGKYQYTAKQNGIYTITAADTAGNVSSQTFAIDQIFNTGALKITMNFDHPVLTRTMDQMGMKVVLTRSDGTAQEIRLGSDMPETSEIFGGTAAINEVISGDSYQTITIELLLPADEYQIAFLGDGYRTYQETVKVDQETDQSILLSNGYTTDGKGSFLAGETVVDGTINELDLIDMIGRFDQEALMRYDCNRDGVIDITDIAYLLQNYSK